MPDPRIAVVGATGVVGETLLRILQERRFPCSALLPLASERSVGRSVRFGGQDLSVREATPDAFDGMDLVFFAATGALSKVLAPAAVKHGATVIDKSSTWRMDPEVALVVPEINAEEISVRPAIIACPNCSTIGVVQVLEPVRRLAGLESVVATTLQAASGSGLGGLEELRAQMAAGAGAAAIAATPGTSTGAERAAQVSVFPRRLHGNVIPQCGSFLDDGCTDEERKLVNETRKIMSLPDLRVAATCVRVPVEVGHCASLYLETERPVTVAQVHAVIAAHTGTRVMDNPAQQTYPTPDDVAGQDDVLVGRVRVDENDPRKLWLWQAGDNLRKGAATNAVQIAEAWVALRR